MSLYTNMCLFSLSGFFFERKESWPIVTFNQTNIFQAAVDGKAILLNKRLVKNLDDPSINVYKIEVIVFVFQL